MSFKSKKTRQKDNLINKQTYIVDRSEQSPSFFQINNYPSELTSGKNAIRLFGRQGALKPGSNIDVEVLDSAGNRVYTEINNFKDQHNNYVISIWVYDDIPKGVGTITIVGEAVRDQNGNQLPPQWRGIPNIKWVREVSISPTKRNDSEILFTNPPRLGIAQVTLPYNEVTATQNPYASSVSDTLTQFVFLDTTFNSSDSEEYTYDIPTQNAIFNPREGARRVSINLNLFPQSQTENTVDGTITKKHKDIFGGVQYQDLAAYNNILSIAETSVSVSAQGVPTNYSGGFTDAMIGARVQIAQIGTKLPSTASNSTVNQLTNEIYTSDVIDVLDSYNLVLRDPFKVSYNTNYSSGVTIPVNHKYKTLLNATASLTFRTLPTFIASTSSFQSFFYFTIEDFAPITGDVYRIKTYIKESGKYGDYELLGDNKVTPPEILVDEGEFNDKPYIENQFKWYGFTSLANIQDYWRVVTDTGTNFTQIVTGLQAYTSSTPQLSSFVLDKKGYEDTNSVSLNSLVMEMKESEFFKQDQIYRVTFKTTADFESGNTPVDECELEVYASSEELLGSGLGVLPRAFDQSLNQDKTTQRGVYSRYGKLLGRIKSKKGSGRYKQYGKVSFEITADRDGIGKLLYRVKKGAFHISEISLTPAVHTGFTPNLLQYALPFSLTGTTTVSQSYDFKFEYFDYLGRQSDYVSYLPRVQVNELDTIPSLGCQRTMISEDGFWPDIGVTSLLPFSDFAPINLSYSNPFFDNIFPGGYPDTGSILHINDFVNPNNSAGLGTANYPTAWGWNYQRYDGAYYTSSTGTTNLTETFGATGGLHSDPTLRPFSNNWNHSSSWVEGYHSSSQDQCACIARNWSSESWRRFENLPSTGYNQAEANTLLKQTRLYWPATTGSVIGAANQYTPFVQNGGIYRIRFKLMQPKIDGENVVTRDYAATYGIDQFAPSGSDATLNVYIYDVGAGILGVNDKGALQPGIASWYPSQNNIFKIKASDIANQLPLTGSFLQYETYLIQWGEKGRLVFESSGSNNSFFGACVDDVEVCQIGTTTDPNFIAPPSYVYQGSEYVSVGPPAQPGSIPPTA